MQPGDRLCLFTDGVTEASNGGSMFGTQALAATLQTYREKPAGELLIALRDAVRSFESGQPPADDLTLLILDYHGPAINAG